jgi:hypothetical protein
MQTTNDAPGGRFSQVEGAVLTRAQHDTRARNLAFAASALIAPVALGRGVAALRRSRLAGVIAGGVSAAIFAALRWQLPRWFTDEPAYVVEGRIGELEIRRYEPHLEARTRLTVPDFETALDEGFRRLAKYIFGHNVQEQSLALTTPVLMMPRGTTHTVAFVMQAERELASLPRPRDERITLLPVPARRFAVLRFRGRYTAKAVLEQTRRLHELVAAADFDTRGEPVFAGFDPPWTLPLVRRNELWIELA